MEQLKFNLPHKTRKPVAAGEKVLKTVDLVKIYGRSRVVKGVSIEISAGEVVGLLGPNGAGKTTTFYMIVGQIRPDGGQIWFDRENITNLAMYRRSQKGLGYLSQEPS
ncbi:ABC transporter ATP-binding protein, partial [sediment metagenome]